MPQYNITIRLPKGATAPAGYELAHSLRGVNIYKKKNSIQKQEIAAIKAEVDDLADLLGKMGVSAVIEVKNPVKPSDPNLNALTRQIGAFSFGGSKKKRTRKHRNSKRYTRRRR